MNASRILKKKLRSDVYIEKKSNEVATALKTSLGAPHLVEKNSGATKNDARYFGDLVKKLKEKFDHTDTTRPQKLQILKLFPDSLSLEEVAKTMNTTKYIGSKCKETCKNEKNIITACCELRKAAT